MPDPEGTRKLEAILAADVAGYSRLMQEDDEATVGTLETYRGIFRERVEVHRGRVVDMAGDSVLAVFDAATGAVRAAFEIQSEIARHNEALPEARRMRFRIGVNIGEVIERSNGTVYGDGVNIAARLEAIGEPGGITISGAVYDQVTTRTRAEFDCIGEQTVKNIADPIRVYRVKSLPAYPLRPASAEGQVATRSAALALPDKPSIAVLPFLNMSGDKEQEYFSDGMTEDIITALTRFIKLSVVARNSSFVYKGKAVDVREVGKQLGVRYVLEGSVRRSQDRVRITAQLIDASDGKHIWAESYDRELKDLFGVQDEVTRQIVGRLDVELDRAQLDEQKRASPKDFRAYNLVLQARRLIYDMSEANHRESRDLLERAIAMDHQLAPAYMGLAWVYLDEYRCGWNARPGALDRALKAAQRAVELEPNNGFAHWRLAKVLFFREEFEQFDIESERALALNPNHAETLGDVACHLAVLDRTDEAFDYAQKAIKLDPQLLWIYSPIAQYYYRKERYREALSAAYKMNIPGFYWTWFWRAAIHAQLGETEAAHKEAAELRRLKPDFVYTVESKLWCGAQSFIAHGSEGARKAGIPVNPGDKWE